MSAQLKRSSANIAVGEALPELVIALTPTGITAAAIATRDFQPVHHDLDRAHSLGNEHVFLNTHTTAGYIERLVMEWAGPQAFLKKISFRMGVPSYSGDVLRLKGEVVAVDAAQNSAEIKVTGTNSRGMHVDGAATVGLG